jgi:Bacterial protein of unknown function (DUF899)
MVRIDKGYVFQGPEVEATLLDLFEGRRQLILYHFMFGPNQDEGCNGCSMFADHIGHLAHLHARDTSLVLVSRAPLAKIEPFKERTGWTVPLVLLLRERLQRRLRCSPELPKPEEYQDGETFGLSVFLREGDEVFRTYFTNGRGLRRTRTSGPSSTLRHSAGRRTGKTHRRLPTDVEVRVVATPRQVRGGGCQNQLLTSARPFLTAFSTGRDRPMGWKAPIHERPEALSPLNALGVLSVGRTQTSR